MYKEQVSIHECIYLQDEAGMLLFTAVEANLALSGFINRKALENIW